MKEKPILFSAPMVRALLDGTKTVTRRVVKLRGWQIAAAPIVDGVFEWWPMQHTDRPTPLEKWSRAVLFGKCPYGEVGDRLYVRETWAPCRPDGKRGRVSYKADMMSYGVTDNTEHPDWESGGGRDVKVFPTRVGTTNVSPLPERWKPSIHMPRWASRITLEVVGVRVERLQSITEADAIAEGVRASDAAVVFQAPPEGGTILESRRVREMENTARGAYAILWDSLNARRGFGWHLDPWVWALTLRRVTP